jgi:alpha-beta hydrolase superfamily lysophospholipase
LLTTGSNKSVECWYAKTDSVSKGTVILFHGLTNSKSSVIAEANEFRYWGYNVLMVDFRGHGGSSGYTSTIGYSETEEVKLAYNWVKQKGESKIILWGTSMGAVAIMKAVADERLQTAALILEMPFGSLHQHMKARAKTVGFPKQPFGVLVTFWTGVRRGFNSFNLNSYRNAEKINCPVLMQWGNNDHLVTRFEVENIFTHIHSNTKKFVVYETGTHSSLLGQGTEQWRLEVSNFLRFLK